MVFHDIVPRFYVGVEYYTSPRDNILILRLQLQLVPEDWAMATPAAATTTASRLYYPFRALGAVTDGLPFVLNRRGDECFLAVSIDRAFQVHPLSNRLSQ